MPRFPLQVGGPRRPCWYSFCASAGQRARWLFALGALSAASTILFVAGVRLTGVAVATVLSSTAPIFALPLGFFVLGERVPPIAIDGIALTIFGIAVLPH